MVDDEDFEFLVGLGSWYWQRSKRKDGLGYAVKEVNGSMVAMHSFLLKISPGYVVDHIDRNGSNNQKANLRQATNAQNCANREKNSNNTSGYKGVFWKAANKKWQAAIQINRRLKHLGYFDCKESAALAYNEAARANLGAFAFENKLEIASGQN